MFIKTYNSDWGRETNHESRITNHGFTLIELMLVIIIIGILGTMAVKNLKGRSDEARMAVARADIETNIAGALDLYELDNGFYPTTEQGLPALIGKPSSQPEPKNWNG